MTGALDPAVEARVRESFALQGFMETIRARLDSLAPGVAEISFAPEQGVTQQFGFVHGGVIAAVLDTACGYAAMTLAPVEAEVLTVEFKVNFLTPTTGVRLVARGEVLRRGRNLSVVQGRAIAGQGPRARETAVMTATIMSLVGDRAPSPQEPT